MPLTQTPFGFSCFVYSPLQRSVHRNATPLVLDMKPDNDNDPLTFVRLATLTQNAIAFLLSKRDEQASNERDDRERKTDKRGKGETRRREICVARV